MIEVEVDEIITMSNCSNEQWKLKMLLKNKNKKAKQLLGMSIDFNSSIFGIRFACVVLSIKNKAR